MAWFFSLVSLVMGIAGIAAMAGYPFWAKHTPVQELTSHPIATRGGQIQPFTVGLDPSMNPVSIQLVGVVGFRDDTDHRYAWRGTLSLDGKTVMSRSASILIKKKDRSEPNPALADDAYAQFGRVEVERAGQYVFALSPHQSDDYFAPTLRRVTVNRNDEPTSNKVIWQGVALIVASGIVQLLFGASRPESEQT